MWAFVAQSEPAFPLLTKLWRSPYGPELELNREGQDALLMELDKLEATVRALVESSEASRRLKDFVRGFRKKYPNASVDGVSVDAALRGTQNMKKFLEVSKTRGWMVYNVVD
jgi:hypothetical protein